MTTDRLGQVILGPVEIDGSCLTIIFCMIGIAIGDSSRATSTSKEMYAGFSQPRRGLLMNRPTINDPAANSAGYAGAKKYNLARVIVNNT
jgi:hypothetical protein